MGKKIDEEELEYFEENIEELEKGLHHIMEINGSILYNMADQISGAVSTTLLPFYASLLLDF